MHVHASIYVYGEITFSFTLICGSTWLLPTTSATYIVKYKHDALNDALLNMRSPNKFNREVPWVTLETLGKSHSLKNESEDDWSY